MFFAVSMSIVNLFLYCTQQLGVTLAVGAQTVLLVAYLQAMRDGTVDEKEQGFTRTARGVVDIGLMLIIVSGLGVITTQFLGGNIEAFFSTIFLFKWSLIGIVLFFTLGNRGTSLASELVQGIAAATWYALFAVHILAPDAGWLELGQFYGIWLVGFMLCWTALVFALRGKPQRKATTIPSKAVAQPAVVIKPNKVVTPKPAAVSITPVQKLPEEKSSGLLASLGQTFHQEHSATAPQPQVVAPPPSLVFVPPPPPTFSPSANYEPKQNSVARPMVESEGSVQVIQTPAIPLPVPPPPPPATLPPIPPTPPPPGPTPAAALTGLHVMPKSPEDIAKRKAM